MADQDPPLEEEHVLILDGGNAAGQLEEDVWVFDGGEPIEDESELDDAVEPEATVIAFTCPHCGEVAMHAVLGRAYWDGVKGREVVTFPTDWRFIQCNECEQVTVEERLDYGDGVPKTGTVKYPSPDVLSADIPEGLQQEWEEAQGAFRAGLYKSSVNAVRTLLEGICAEHGIDKGTLDLSLQEMNKQDLMDPMLFEWANLLRLVGNEGSHYNLERVTQEDAADALSFADALLDHIYVLRVRFASFEARHKARAEAKKAAKAAKKAADGSSSSSS